MAYNQHHHFSPLSILSVCLAGLLLCACTAPVPDEREGHEILLQASPLTRGVVTGTELVDNVTGARQLFVTAFLHPQSGQETSLVQNVEFRRSAGYWRSTPPLYWPIGGRLDLLCYSAVTAFDDADIIWSAGNCAERMRLRVGNDRTQDDILFGSAWGATSSSGGTVSLELYHSQAFIEILLSDETSPEFPVRIDAVYLTDTYDAGILDIENNYGYPEYEYEWDLRSVTRADRLIDDPDGVYGTTASETVKSLRMLIPEQPKKSLRVRYTCLGETLERTLPVGAGNWLAGSHYVYSLLFAGSGLTFTMQLRPWGNDAQNIDFFPID